MIGYEAQRWYRLQINGGNSVLNQLQKNMPIDCLVYLLFSLLLSLIEFPFKMYQHNKTETLWSFHGIIRNYTENYTLLHMHTESVQQMTFRCKVWIFFIVDGRFQQDVGLIMLMVIYLI